MKRQVLAILVVALFTAGCAGTARISRLLISKAVSEEPARPATSLTVGERLTFRATWKGLLVGRATITIEELMPFKEYEVYKVVVKAWTTPFISRLFKVEDTFISYVDKDTLVSRYYEASIKEGRYRKELVVDYDFGKKLATYNYLKDGTVKTGPIEEDVRDPISAAYYFRTMPVRSGDRIKLNINLGTNNYEIFADIKERANVTIRRLGSFDAFLIRPYMKLKGKVQQRGKAWGYVSSDEKRLPLSIVVKVLEIPWIGNVIATLEKVENISPAKN